MKKILLLLSTVLTCVSAWAQPKVSDAPVNGEWAENTTWYTMKNGNGNYISNKHVDDNGNLKWNSNEYTNYDRRAHWCIVGNETDGYLFYNKAVGAGKALVTTGEEAAARTNFTEVAAATKFYLAESKKAGYWCVRKGKDGNNYWNARGDYLALWNSTDAVNGWKGSGTGDNGSAIMFEIAIDSDDMTELTYVLTDELGTTYTGTYEGVAGVSDPVLEGVAGYTLSDKKWNANKMTATIKFPFPVSKDGGVTNATMISNFNAYQRWHAVGTDVKVQTMDVDPANINEWLWAIYPSFADGKFTFVVKNMSTGTYLFTEKTESSFDKQGTVVLAEEGTPLEVVSWLNSPCFTVSGKTLYLTINGSADTDVYLATYVGGNNNHGGNKLYFPSYAVVSLNEAGYASTFLSFDAALPEGLESYAVTAASATKATLTSLEGVKANQGAILKGAASTEYVLATAKVASDWSGNLLKGSATDTEVAGEGYVLASKDGVTAFYKAKLTDGKFKNNAGKAYLPASAVTTAGARCLSFDFGTETAIESVESVENNAVVYDLAGRRVQNAQKGLYIVNGKVVIK